MERGSFAWRGAVSVFTVAIAVACSHDYDAFAFDDDGGGAAGGSAGAGGGSSGTGGASGNQPGVVNCVGANDCSLSSDFCCVGSGGPSCQDKDDSCVPGLDVFCDGPEDCPEDGDVCCATFSGGGALRCRSEGYCADSGRRVVCGSTPSVCGNGSNCQPLNAGSAYNICEP